MNNKKNNNTKNFNDNKIQKKYKDKRIIKK